MTHSGEGEGEDQRTVTQAEGRVNDLLVAAITITPLLLVSRPSMQVRIWFRVFSCSLFIEPIRRDLRSNISRGDEETAGHV